MSHLLCNVTPNNRWQRSGLLPLFKDGRWWICLNLCQCECVSVRNRKEGNFVFLFLLTIGSIYWIDFFMEHLQIGTMVWCKLILGRHFWKYTVCLLLQLNNICMSSEAPQWSSSAHHPSLISWRLCWVVLMNQFENPIRFFICLKLFDQPTDGASSQPLWSSSLVFFFYLVPNICLSFSAHWRWGRCALSAFRLCRLCTTHCCQLDCRVCFLKTFFPVVDTKHFLFKADAGVYICTHEACLWTLVHKLQKSVISGLSHTPTQIPSAL